MRTEKIAVVGAGPSGMAAAVQLELYGLSPLVFEPDTPGGLLLNAYSVSNYPGVRRGITGRELAGLFQTPGNIVKQRVVQIKALGAEGYELVTETETFLFNAVIAATGTNPVKIEIQGCSEEDVYYEVRDIPAGLYGSAAIIGGGDASLDYALTLSRTMTVNVYARSGFSRSIPHLLSTVENSERITLYPGTAIPAPHVEDIVVAACGRTPNVAFVSEDLLCSPPADGSFHLCGDCVNGRHRQTAIAVGDGVMAAMRTAEYLK